MRPGEMRQAAAEAAQGFADHRELLWMSRTVPMKIHTRIQGLIAIVIEPRTFARHMPADWLVICCFSITDQQPSHSKSKRFTKDHKGNLQQGKGQNMFPV